MTKQFSSRPTPLTRRQAEELAERSGSTITDVLATAIDKLYNTPQCNCEGRATIGWHAGGWVYCTCRLGIAAAMEELDSKMSILADDLQTMPRHKCNAEIRARKEFYFEQLTAEHDSLEREFERLAEAES